MEKLSKVVVFYPKEVGTPVTVCDTEMGVAIFFSNFQWLGGVFLELRSAKAEASWAGCQFKIIN